MTLRLMFQTPCEYKHNVEKKYCVLHKIKNATFWGSMERGEGEGGRGKLNNLHQTGVCLISRTYRATYTHRLIRID